MLWVPGPYFEWRGPKNDSFLHRIKASNISLKSITRGTWLLPRSLGGQGLTWPSFLFIYSRLLLRIPLYSFSMVLVDKHGTDKERYVSLVTPMALFNLIDTFPLRKEEMILQAEMGQTCNTWCDVTFLVVLHLFLRSAVAYVVSALYLGRP